LGLRFSRRQVLGTLAALGATTIAQACGAPAAPANTPAAAKPADAAAAKPAATTAPAAPAAAAAATTAPAAAAATPAAAAPAAASKPGKSIQLSWWFWADDADQAKMYTDVVDTFNQKSDKIQVTPDFYSMNPDLRKKLLTSFAAGAGAPDTTHSLTNWMPDFNDSKLVVPLDDQLKSWPTYAEWIPNIEPLARVRSKDPLGMIPTQVLISYLYYRADWLADAKLQPPDSLDDMVNVAKALTKAPDQYGYGFRGGDNGGLSQQLSHYLRGNGVAIIQDDGTTVDLDSDDAVATVDWYVGLYSKQKVTQPTAVTDKFPELFAALQGNKLALMHHGLWSYAIQEKALGDKIAAVQIPKGAKTRYVDTFMEGESIISSSKQRDAAWEFITYLALPDQMRIFSAKRGAGPVAKSMVNDKIYSENRFYKAALASQPAWGNLPYYHKNWTKMTDQYAPELQRLMKGETTAQQFCKTLADTLRNG
jgi:multiple sugar transport system substrate-binding protein